MATRFEILLLHDDAQYARQAAEAAFSELDRLEQTLSRYIETSDITRINRLKPGEQSRIGLDVFACLKECLELYVETEGAFDVGIGELITAWKSATPDEETINCILKNGGIQNIQLHADPPAVSRSENSITIDLGGYGKGYALDRMAEILREWDVECALLHGGMSTALALESPPNETGWPITISHPVSQKNIKTLHLSNAAFSGSGLQKGPHIIDPRTGQPADHPIAAWVLTKRAARADARSTSFMMMNPDEINAWIQNHTDEQGATLDADNQLLWFPTTDQSA